MFSSIFGAISQIKEAIKAGSDNLVQYSSSYNNSISSMVSSLLYLKNAWAAAFAPIVNVVEERLAPIKKAYKFILEGINPFTRIKRDIEFAVNAFAELQKFLDKFKKDIQKKLEDLFKPSSFVEIGKNILKGIARGFAERFDLFPALNFFNWVYDRICELFGIHSPAKNMEPLGENIFLGIVKGFENKFDSFTDAISQWYEKNVKPWFSTNKWSGLSKNVKSSFSDIDDWFGKKFQKARNLVNEKFQNVGTWFFARKTDVQVMEQCK